MCKSLKNKNDKFAKENKLSYPALVILGPVPRILWKQGINLVNKFVLLSNKYRLREDSRNKSENDWCWGRRLSVYSAFTRNVISRRYSLLGVPPKYDVDSSVQYGRSMIEMLGVLAIIAVLSVGGIAGYSKAMEKWKMNRTIGEYSSMLVGVIENIDAFTSKNSWSSTVIVQALNIAPAGWKVEKTSHLNLMRDNTGNKVEWFPENDRQLRIIFHLGGGESHQRNLCVTLINDVILPLRSVVGMLYFNSGGIYYYLGDNYCSESKKGWEKCMSYLNLSNINQQCNSCAKSGICTLNLLFYH